jgi:RNA polymerase sigma factor (sigma-70 family)
LSEFSPVGYYLDEMQSKSDAQLLREYAERGADAAFTELVQRHTNLVYSAALRQMDSPDGAAEIAQRVFISLARGAQALVPRLTADASLAGWLCRSARNLSLNHRRDDFRRQTRERQAMEQLISTSDDAPNWEHLRRVLDDAMAELNEADYDALVLRFFQQQDYRSVGAALGVSDDTAQKRVTRALEKLREALSRRRITASAAALSVVISANAVQAAPAGLALTISAATALTGTTLATTATVTATKAIAMTALQKTIVTATIAVLAGAGIYEARQAAQLRNQVQTLQQQQAPIVGQAEALQRERNEMANRLSALADALEKSKGNSSELLRLRGEVARLRTDSRELAEMKAAEASDPAASELKSWLARVKQLKHEAENNPRAQIPEFSLLTEQDWLNAAKWYGRRPQIDAETDLRIAMADVRQTAQNAFANLAQQALARYAKDHDGGFPTDLTQFKPYLPISVDGRNVDETILQRYKIEPAEKFHLKATGQDWVIALKELVDDEYDHVIAIGPVNWGYQQSDAEKLPPDVRALKRTLDPAAKEFSAANNGQEPTDPSQLLPYLKTDEQRAALQKAIELRNSPTPMNK